MWEASHRASVPWCPLTEHTPGPCVSGVGKDRERSPSMMGDTVVSAQART